MFASRMNMQKEKKCIKDNFQPKRQPSDYQFGSETPVFANKPVL